MNQSTKADQIVPANVARQTANDETSGQTPEKIFSLLRRERRGPGQLMDCCDLFRRRRHLEQNYSGNVGTRQFARRVGAAMTSSIAPLSGAE